MMFPGKAMVAMVNVSEAAPGDDVVRDRLQAMALACVSAFPAKVAKPGKG